MRKLDEKEFPGVLKTTVFIFLFLEREFLFKSLFEKKTRGLVIDVVVEWISAFKISFTKKGRLTTIDKESPRDNAGAISSPLPYITSRL